MNDPLYVAYFTKDSPYEGESLKLRESLVALQLPHEITAMDDHGSWQANTQLKSVFLQSRLKEHRGRPIIYVDVDALVLRQPIIFKMLQQTSTCDVAASRFRGVDLLSGTVYFHNDDRTAEIVDRWVALCKQFPEKFPPGRLSYFNMGGDAWDQRLLDIAIRETPNAKFYELPPEYCYIIGLSQKEFPDAHPVILHTRGRLRFETRVNHG